MILFVFWSLLKFGREVGDHDDKMPDELLYGRAGYLFSLLYVKSYYDSSAISSAAIESVCWIKLETF